MDKNVKLPLKLNLLIADSQPVFRAGLKNVLKKIIFLGEVYEASNGNEALGLCHEKQVHIALMDIRLSPMNGYAASEKIRKQFPEVKIITFTECNQPHYLAGMYRMGVHGYILKDAPIEELIKALYKVSNNETYFSPEANGILVKGLMAHKRSEDLEVNDELSVREREILGYICKQRSNEEIAMELFLSPNTVKTHRQHIMGKTNSKNLGALMVYALRHEYVSLEEL